MNEKSDAKLLAQDEEVNFLLQRRGSKDIVMAGNEVNQTFSLQNNTGFDISNIMIVDTIGDGATFKERSLQIDGISYADFSPINGFTLPEKIKSGNSSTITYRVIIDDPLEDSIRIIGVASSVTFTINGLEQTKNSNVYQMKVASGDVFISKTSNISVTIKGQTLTFQNIIQNTGTQKNTNVFFQDLIPEGTTFVENSVKFDGVSKEGLNPQNGFMLPDIEGESRLTVSFDVVVN